MPHLHSQHCFYQEDELITRLSRSAAHFLFLPILGKLFALQTVRRVQAQLPHRTSIPRAGGCSMGHERRTRAGVGWGVHTCIPCECLIPGVANSFQSLSHEGVNPREGLGEKVIFSLSFLIRSRTKPSRFRQRELGAARAASPSAGPGWEMGHYWPGNIQIYLFKK